MVPPLVGDATDGKIVNAGKQIASMVISESTTKLNSFEVLVFVPVHSLNKKLGLTLGVTVTVAVEPSNNVCEVPEFVPVFIHDGIPATAVTVTTNVLVNVGLTLTVVFGGIVNTGSRLLGLDGKPQSENTALGSGLAVRVVIPVLGSTDCVTLPLLIDGGRVITAGVGTVTGIIVVGTVVG